MHRLCRASKTFFYESRGAQKKTFMNFISLCAEDSDAYEKLPSVCERVLQALKRSMAETNIAVATDDDINIIFVEFHAFDEESLPSLGLIS